MGEWASSSHVGRADAKPAHEPSTRGVLPDGRTINCKWRLLLQAFNEALLGTVSFEAVKANNDGVGRQSNVQALVESLG